jgi:hypothetical protein
MQLGFAVKRAIESRANLTDAILTDANLSGAILTGAYLSRTNLSGANLSDANLSGAIPTYANLSRTNLSGANLSGTNLSGAYLSGANMLRANLSRANLTVAILTVANLSDANLSGAKWRDGITIKRAPLQLFSLYWPVTILDDHMQIGCELHTIAEWAAFDDRRIAEMSGTTALRFWRAHKESLLALAASDGRGVEVAVAEKAE